MSGCLAVNGEQMTARLQSQRATPTRPLFSRPHFRRNLSSMELAGKGKYENCETKVGTWVHADFAQIGVPASWEEANSFRITSMSTSLISFLHNHGQGQERAQNARSHVLVDPSPNPDDIAFVHRAKILKDRNSGLCFFHSERLASFARVAIDSLLVQVFGFT